MRVRPEAEFPIRRSGRDLYFFDRPARAWMRRQGRIPHKEEEGGLELGVLRDLTQLRKTGCSLAVDAFVVDHFDGFVAGADSHPTGGCEKMDALP